MSSKKKHPRKIFNKGSINIEVNRKDCIQYLSDLDDGSMDVIITDPAYSGMNNKLKLGKGRIVGNYSDKGENGKWFKEFEDTEENYREFLGQCKRVLNKETGHLFLMFDSYSLLSLGTLVREYFDVKNLLVWDKVNIGMGHYFRRRHEMIIFATNGNTRKLKSQTYPDILEFKRIYRAKYSTQKPVELFQTLIEASSKKGFNVCDPFLGSGSSAIAAIKEGCNFYGTDISKEAFEISSERISEFISSGLDIYQKKSSKPD